jgi:hypothetical protein
MKTDRQISEEEFLSFAVANALPWEPNEIEKVKIVINKLKPKLTQLRIKFPETILMIKTTGREEGGAAYTRSNAIILPQGIFNSEGAALEHLVAHEMLHTFTRNDPEVRKLLYAVIGFIPCGEINFPKELKALKITNPDAPMNDHYIRVIVDGNSITVVPILFSREPKYDVVKGGEFFQYLSFKLMQIDRQESEWKPCYDKGRLVLFDPGEVSGFFKQVGRNTNYIIHPEEILADNFAILVNENENVPSPGIINKIKQVLSKSKKNKPN